MTQIEKDIRLLREKYGDMRSIKTAEAILRLVAFAEKHKDCDNGKSGKQGRLENEGE
jgi:hypothetical protein